MTSFIKLILGQLFLLISGLKERLPFHSKNAGKVTILMFHNIPFDHFNKFKRIINKFNENNDFISPTDFSLFMDNKKEIIGKKLLLTFDDGFFSNYLLAKQILDPLGIKAIYFVPTGFIDSNDHTSQKSFAVDHIQNGVMPGGFDEDELRPMSWNQIKELVDNGHLIGAHTNNHTSLSNINEDKILEYEIISSADKIEKILGVRIDHFAYPFGQIDYINKKAIDIAKKRFRFIYSGVRGENTVSTNPLALRREAVNIFDNLQLIKIIGLGSLSFLYWRKRRRLDRMAN